MSQLVTYYHVLWGWIPYLPMPVALAAVALLGYLVGRQRREAAAEAPVSTHRELDRALAVADQLQRIADSVRKQLARHEDSVDQFKSRLSELTRQEQEETWRQLCNEAEAILRPTLQLANQIAYAYDEIRHQTNHLMTFSEVRTDALTGVRNRRALNESLDSLIALKARYDQPFALLMVDIDHFKKINDALGHVAGDRVLRNVAKLFNDHVRETDVLARYGGEEFVILMPQADLPAACAFAERLRREVQQHQGLESHVTISVGVAAALAGEQAPELIHRADAALYEAKSAGRNCVRQHNGTVVEAVPGEALAVC